MGELVPFSRPSIELCDQTSNVLGLPQYLLFFFALLSLFSCQHESEDVDFRPDIVINDLRDCEHITPPPPPLSLSVKWEVDQISGHQTFLEMLPPFQNITHIPHIQKQSCSD